MRDRRLGVGVAGDGGDDVVVAGLQQLQHEVVAVDAAPQLGHEDVAVGGRDVGRVGDDRRRPAGRRRSRPGRRSRRARRCTGRRPRGRRCWRGRRSTDGALMSKLRTRRPGRRADDVADRRRVAGAELDDAVAPPSRSCVAVLLEQHADREAVVRRLVGGGEAAHEPSRYPGASRGHARRHPYRVAATQSDRSDVARRRRRPAARGRAPGRCRCRPARRACGPARAPGPRPRPRGCRWR